MAAKARILVVEQQAAGAGELSGTLLQLGYDVPAVHLDSHDAVDSSFQLRPDLILMDISPGSDTDGIALGHTVSSRLDIPIIYLTAHDHEEHFRRALSTNPWGYLLKPLDSCRLRHAIEIALQKKTLSDELKGREERYRMIFDLVGGAVMLVGKDGVISLVNGVFLDWAGLSRSEVESRMTWPEVLITSVNPLGMGNGERDRGERTFVAHFAAGRGLPKAVHVTVSVVPASGDRIVSMVDISQWKRDEDRILAINSELVRTNRELSRQLQERVKMEEHLVHQATHDPLTGLPNRALLFDRLKQSFGFEDRHNKLLALMLLDLDDFKAINDTMGHFCGDLLLTGIAGRLKECMRQYDTVARLGGDEFVLILNDVADVGDVVRTVGKISAIVRKPIDIMGKEVAVTASIGVAVYPLHGTTAESLLNMADLAMYEAKKAGKDSFRFFAQERMPESGGRAGDAGGRYH